MSIKVTEIITDGKTKIKREFNSQAATLQDAEEWYYREFPMRDADRVMFSTNGTFKPEQLEVVK